MSFSRAARYVWAMLLARIYEVLPLTCPRCGGAMRIIVFINDPAEVKKILAHLGEPTEAPRLAPARGPPLREVARRICSCQRPAKCKTTGVFLDFGTFYGETGSFG